MEELQDTLAEQQHAGTLIKEEVTNEDIAEVVAKWTGIPVTKMLQSEREKLLKLEQVLLQDGVVDTDLLKSQRRHELSSKCAK